jgi:hypothetical protein
LVEHFRSSGRTGSAQRAITSRPLLFHATAERVRHARQTTIKIAGAHARPVQAAQSLRAVAMFLRGLVRSAEQLTYLQRWREILARTFKAFRDPYWRSQL